MKKSTRFLFLFAVMFAAFSSHAQNPENWTKEQLMEPSVLAASISSAKDVPLIICVGPGAPIPNSVNVGLVNNKHGLKKLKAALATIDKNKKIVIYCGCCPFEHCPNVRPAIDVLKEMKFTNYYLFNLPQNLKADWIDKGYPVTDTKPTI